MLQLKNTSPFAATMVAFPDQRGVETLFAVVKATFALRPDLEVAEQQVPVQAADVPWGEPGASSLKYASELHLCKPGTDAVMVGSAWTTRNPRKDQVDVLFAVAGRTSVVRVFGDRQWRPGVLGLSASPPVPFESMPIVYERAYGGTHQPDPKSGRMLAEERNPVGVGFKGKRGAREFAGQPLPNVEDPLRPIRSPGDAATPKGFGFVAPSWLPRRGFAGTYDKSWQERRAPYLPEDFDPRFFHAAHPELVFERHLQGGELVELVNGSAGGPLMFHLPTCRLDVAVLLAGAEQRPAMNLETVLLEPDDNRLCLLWRGAVPVDKQLLRVERVTIGLQELTIAGGKA